MGTLYVVENFGSAASSSVAQGPRSGKFQMITIDAYQTAWSRAKQKRIGFNFCTYVYVIMYNKMKLNLCSVN